MWRFLRQLILLLTLISGAQAPLFAALIPNEVIVTFKPGSTTRQQIDLLQKTLKLKVLRTGFGLAFRVVEVPRGVTPASVIDRLQAQPAVSYAEQNVTTAATSLGAADDPYFFAGQWNLQGQDPGGIGVDRAWAVSTGAGVKVAVVDTGCAYATARPYFAAPDLNQSNIVPLWDWANMDPKPHDDDGHGTFLCSIIASRLNNRRAIAGIAPDVRLLISKVMGPGGKGRADALASGIAESAARGAQIILVGCETNEHSRVVQDAIDHVAGSCIVVMGAGNAGANLDLRPEAHAVYDRTLVVGATTRQGQLAPYSNYGSHVDLLAPGGSASDQILAQSFTPFGAGSSKFAFPSGADTVYPRYGTSIAAAHVAGVLALTQSAGKSMDLRRTAHSVEVVLDGRFRRYAMIDAAAALGLGSSGSGGGSGDDGTPPASDIALSGIVVPAAGAPMGSRLRIQVAVTNEGARRDTVTVTLRDQTDGQDLGSRQVEVGVGESGSVEFNWSAGAPLGAHSLVAEAQVSGDIDPADNTRTATVSVLNPPLAVSINSYAPTPGEEAQGTPQGSFVAGDRIGLEFLTIGFGLPAAGATVNYTVTGATGATVATGSIVTDSSGRATVIVADYYLAGGPGTYRVDVTASKDADTALGTYPFLVTTGRSGR